MEYEKVLKHCKKVVSKKETISTRKVLEGVYHSGNEVIVTDAKRMVIAEIDNAKFSNIILDVKSGELLEGKYPSTNRLLLSENSSIQLDIDKKTIEEMKRVLRRIKNVGFKIIELKLEKENDKSVWYLQPKPNPDIDITDFAKAELRFAFAEDENSDEQKKMLDIKYFVNAIDFVKDNKSAGTTLVMTDSAVTPIQFNNQKGNQFKYKYLVMPMRDH